MEEYGIESDGQKYIFSIFKRITEPCPHCGVQACGKEDIFWFENDGKRISLIYDGSTINLMLEDYFKQPNVLVDKEPAFIKEWHLGSGWYDCWDYDGYTLDARDLESAISKLGSVKFEDWFVGEANELLDSIREILKMAKEAGKPLKVVRG